MIAGTSRLGPQYDVLVAPGIDESQKEDLVQDLVREVVVVNVLKEHMIAMRDQDLSTIVFRK